MRFGLMVIGDEIMSGKRRDKHFDAVAEIMGTRGLRLSWAGFLGDDRQMLTEWFARSLKTTDVVFSCGGIGNTPDDHTRQAVAAALGVPLVLHPEAAREISARFNGKMSPQQALLGTFPEGAAIIPNPFNRIPGFSVGSHYFVPGFPQMAWPMIEWALDRYYVAAFPTRRIADRAVLVTGSNAYESALLDLMDRIVADYPELRLYSLPSLGDDGRRRHLELGVEGEPGAVERAMEAIRTEIERRGLFWRWRPDGDTSTEA